MVGLASSSRSFVLPSVALNTSGVDIPMEVCSRRVRVITDANLESMDRMKQVTMLQDLYTGSDKNSIAKKG